MDLGVRKLGRNDINLSNPYGDQTTHFVDYTKSFNASNSSYNCKKKGNTFEAKPIMCVSFVNEGKRWIGWAVIVGRRVWKWASANNIPPKGSPCCAPDYDEMIVRSLCLKTSKKYNGDGCA